MNTNEAPNNFAVFANLIVYLAGQIAGNCKANALVRAAKNGGIDADHIAMHINQWSATGPGVNGDIGLQEFLEDLAVVEIAAAFGADDARGDRLIESVRIANGPHHFADIQLVAIAPGGGG